MRDDNFDIIRVFEISFVTLLLLTTYGWYLMFGLYGGIIYLFLMSIGIWGYYTYTY